MKKILLSFVALMAAIITTQAKEYQVYFDNGTVQVTDENKDDLTSLLSEAGLLTGGTVTFSANGDMPKLTLNGAKLQAVDGGYWTTLRISENLTLELVGENEIVFGINKTWGYSLRCAGNAKITLTGDGSLTCKATASSMHDAVLINEGATLVIDGHATLIATGRSVGVSGDKDCKLVVNNGTLRVVGADSWGRAHLEVLGGIQLAEGVRVTQPAGARLSDDCTWVRYENGNPIPTDIEVVITNDSSLGIGSTTISAQNKGVRYNLQGLRVGEKYRGVVIENGHKRFIPSSSHPNGR